MSVPFEIETELEPAEHLAAAGRVFAVFDARTQDSGNVSFALEAGGARWFVKTAGDPAAKAHLDHAARVALLANAERVAAARAHPALPALRAVGRCAWGPMLVYDWVPGELLRLDPRDPACAHLRLRRRPPAEITAALTALIDAHAALCGAGWVACDFYDGAMIYDFESGRLGLVDLDHYHQGPFVNGMGRLFGSMRFMAPEELELGAVVDQRTTVFNLGRAIASFLGDGSLEQAAFRGSEAQHVVMARACRPDPAERFASVAGLAEAWRGQDRASR